MYDVDTEPNDLIGPYTVNQIEDLRLADSAFYVFSNAEDYDRSNMSFWKKFSRSLDPSAFAIVERSDIDGRMTITCAGTTVELLAGDYASFRDLVPHGAEVVVDISAIGHDFIASCIVALKDHVGGLAYIYTEPRDYKFRSKPDHPDPFDATMFDLSSAIGGVRSLPGFVNLLGPGRMDALFVPLLGFEGTRALNLLNSLDPAPPTIIPVVGVPGYRPEFPTYTAICNRTFFRETQSAPKVRLAAAYDPFALRETLRGIQTDYPNHYLYVAPIGTRPHAVGALMFALENPATTEILFDHPARTKGSRLGAGASHVFRVL